MFVGIGFYLIHCWLVFVCFVLSVALACLLFVCCLVLLDSLYLLSFGRIGLLRVLTLIVVIIEFSFVYFVF